MSDGPEYYDAPPRVEVWVMDPAAEGFRLDKTPLNSLNPLQAAHVANAFTLDSRSNGRLNNDRLYPVGPGMVWLNITQWITSIRTSQSQQDTADMAPDAGSCEIRFLNAPSFTTLPVYAGTPIRIIRTGALKHYLTGEWLTEDEIAWCGHVEDISETWDKTTARKTTTLTAVDGVARLSDITRYGRRGEGVWIGCLRDLLTSSPYADLPIGLPFQRTPPPGGEPWCCGTVYEGPLSRHISMVAATAGLIWNIIPDPSGTTSDIGPVDPGAGIGESRQRLRLVDPATVRKPQVVLTDLPYDEAGIVDYRTPMPYTAIEIAGGTRAITSVVELTAHRISDDGHDESVNTTHANPTALEQWGVRTARVDAVPMPGDENRVAGYILDRSADAAARPVSVTLHGRHATESGTSPIRMLTAVDVFRLGHRYRCLVVGVQNRWEIITDPYPRHKHTVTLKLARRA